MVRLRARLSPSARVAIASRRRRRRVAAATRANDLRRSRRRARGDGRRGFFDPAARATRTPRRPRRRRVLRLASSSPSSPSSRRRRGRRDVATSSRLVAAVASGAVFLGFARAMMMMMEKGRGEWRRLATTPRLLPASLLHRARAAHPAPVAARGPSHPSSPRTRADASPPPPSLSPPPENLRGSTSKRAGATR